MNTRVFGKTIDNETRCAHYHSSSDIIAIKFKCCKEYYPCYECHRESAGHHPEVWGKDEFDEKAILCGVCKQELTINQYLNSNNICPNCSASFNPNCAKHYSFYFEVK